MGLLGVGKLRSNVTGKLQLNELQVLVLFFDLLKKCWSSRLHVGCGIFKLLTCSLLQPGKEKPLPTKGLSSS